jgi:hypothetical protein
MRAPFADRTRRVIGWLLLTVGLLGTSLVYDAFMVRKLVLDPNVVVDATDNILERRVIQSAVADQIVEAARSQLLPPGTTSSATLHVTDDLRQAGIELTRTPEFHDAYAAAVRALHSYIFIDHSVAPVLDLSAFVPLFRTEAIALNPLYAQLLPAQAALRIQMTDRAPDLTGIKRSLDRRFALLAMATAGLIALAMLIHSRRAAALRRIGMWLIAFALLQGAIALLLPVVASALPGNSSIIADHLARSLMPRLIAPAVALLLFGIGAWVCARRWQRLHDERNERTGANAFLDPDQLLKISGTGAPFASMEPLPSPVPSPVAMTSSLFDALPPAFDGFPQSSRLDATRRRHAPVAPAAFFDPPETRSPPVDSLGLSVSQTMLELGALPTKHRVDD